MKRFWNPLFWHHYLTTNGWKMNNWNPNDPILRSPMAPHETRATLRLKQNGWPGDDIRKMLNMGATKLIASLKEGMNEETDAQVAGRQIVGGTVEKGTR